MVVLSDYQAFILWLQRGVFLLFSIVQYNKGQILLILRLERGVSRLFSGWNALNLVGNHVQHPMIEVHGRLVLSTWVVELGDLDGRRMVDPIQVVHRQRVDRGVVPLIQIALALLQLLNLSSGFGLLHFPRRKFWLHQSLLGNLKMAWAFLLVKNYALVRSLAHPLFFWVDSLHILDSALENLGRVRLISSTCGLLPPLSSIHLMILNTSHLQMLLRLAAKRV